MDPKPDPTPDFLRHVQAAFKRHKPLGTMPSNFSRARRVLVTASAEEKGVGCGKGLPEAVLPEESSITGICAYLRGNESGAADTSSSKDGWLDGKVFSLDGVKIRRANGVDGSSVSASCAIEVPCQGAEERMVNDTRSNNLSSCLGSLALTEGLHSLNDRAGFLNSNSQDLKLGDFENVDIADMKMRSVATHLPPKQCTPVHDQNSASFLGKETVHPMTQSSVAGSSCVTTSIHSLSAPMLNSMIYNSLSNRHKASDVDDDRVNDFELNQKPLIQGTSALSGSSFHCSNGLSVRQTATSIQVSTSAPRTLSEAHEISSSKDQGLVMRENNAAVDQISGNSNLARVDEKSAKEKGVVGDAADMQSQTPLTKNTSVKVNLEVNQSSKIEKAISSKGTSAARKKSFDPDVFFKVNGKFYQKLGRIGSGGSSEVHKVISSDCTIYALKKIKLKGRDYSTAYGFCQEIEYLNKLKGKKNIIQLIDYEVTDKTLLEDVMSGTMNIKDGRIKDDRYIYMVLEYGEIDLAQMLSQKWKGMDGSCWEIDENWLRFYWQQILHAVYTIHEERIVHSDLKPANFLLVKGSLKLIDFGIAKSIMSDTTNIQRDAQVGTLNYMAPEAFMWNEHDESGNTIKCGRPSDIWSLGCILYQMVYGSTPFAEYKTFWAKFKVITDRNHEIKYDPVSNPWLLDLMKKCLAWERTERWRIPELLQHPFLVPPIPSQLPTSEEEQCRLLRQMVERYQNIPEVSRLCFQLQQLILSAADARM